MAMAKANDVLLMSADARGAMLKPRLTVHETIKMNEHWHRYTWCTLPKLYRREF
jgi:hypothetical protein